MMKSSPEILVHPMMVQANLKPGASFSVMHTGESESGIEFTADDRLKTEAEAVASLRQTNPTNHIRVLTVDQNTDFHSEQLVSPRDSTWNLSRSLVETMGEKAAYYFLRDQNQYDVRTTGLVLRSDAAEKDIFVRAEEGLLPLAEELIDSALVNATSTEKTVDVDRCSEHHDCILRANESGNQSHIPLRGYTFSPKDSAVGERIRFDYFPSCAVFIAAAAIEQMSLAPHTVRIFNRSIKDREYAARTLVKLYGIKEPTIDSVATGDDGSINKLISWHADSARKKWVRDLIRSAHRRVSDLDGSQ